MQRGKPHPCHRMKNMAATNGSSKMYKIIYDPLGLYVKSEFPSDQFDVTREMGNWPDGMMVKDWQGKFLEVKNSELIEVRL